MYLSINWLQDFIPQEIPVQDLADRLTMSGIEVEEIIRTGSEWDNVVVGEILEITRHPNAEKLQLAKVTTGEKILPIVCGAPNIAVGQHIALAVEGAQLPGGMTIKKSKIRGEISEGMICSEPELGLGEDHSGIMVLPPDAPLGMPLARYLKLSDTIFNLGITPNRADCLSVVGLAREIAALFGIPLQLPQYRLEETGDAIDTRVAVEIADADLCPRYTARLVTGLTVKPSPLWMQRRLVNCGIRAINNLVDITNYILLEWGQPLHAFDYSFIQDGKIIVRRAARGEKFTTLDAIARELPDNALMICDGRRPVAIAGIMGGENSGILPATDTVLIESAYFTPHSIARTSRALNLKTEASLRFEKGIDINGVLPSLHRAAQLMAEFGCGKIARGCIDAYPAKLAPPRPVRLSVKKTNAVTGLSLSQQDVTSVLERLHMATQAPDADTLLATAPSFRYDLNEPIDLIEEIARLTGYDHIPVTYPRAALSGNTKNRNLKLAGIIRDMMIARGFFEVINYSFCGPEHIAGMRFAGEDARSTPLPILNPLASSQSVMRTSIVPSLLLNLQENLNNKSSAIKLFELSRVFIQQSGSPQPQEPRRLAGLMAGMQQGEGWNLQNAMVDFYDIKAAVESLLQMLRIRDTRFLQDGREPFLHPHKMLSIYAGDHCIGCLGEVHPDVLEHFDVKVPAYVFELDVDQLAKLWSDAVSFAPFSRQPAILRDIALIVDDTVPAEKFFSAVAGFKNKLLTDMKIFDSFRGGTIQPGKKSLAFRVKFQSNDRTLTDAEVNKIHDRLVAHLVQATGAELRQ
ncbi:MAG: phenylalanine--tRNA ligase subunit beta [Deltaproteobacteria bacterium]|nr:phenylalanine--tRNA ligase subunit beta [Deltaproteobacteria bacterium]